MVMLAISISVSQLTAQDLDFEYITSDDGLSHSSVSAIVQDNDGFMWFGTFNGLNRYDGYNFVKFYHDPKDSTSIVGDQVEDLLIDSEGHLWIGNNNGLSCYDKDRNIFINYTQNLNTTGGFIGNNAIELFEDSKGRIWIGTFGAGVNYFDTSTKTFKNFQNDPQEFTSISGNVVRGIGEDEEGNIWIGTENSGLNLFIESTETFQRFIHNPEDPESFPFNGIYTVINDHQNNVWIGMLGGGICKVIKNEKGEISFESYRPKTNDQRRLRVLSLAAEENGNIWIGTENGGLDCFNTHSKSFTNYHYDEIQPNSLNNNSIHAIYKDKSDNLWIGTYTGGVNVYKANKKAFGTFRKIPGDPYSLSYNAVTSFYEDLNGKIWIGTDGGGVNIWDRSKGIFTCYNSENSSLASDAILAINVDNNNGILIGGWEAAFSRYSGDGSFYTITKEQGLPNENIFDIINDQNGDIWASFGGIGFGKFNPETETFEMFTPSNSNLPSVWVLDMCEDFDGNILLGHTLGISVFSIKDHSFINYTNDPTDSSSISQNQINTLLVTRDSSIWVGTVSGLNLFLPTDNKFMRYYEEDGLVNNNIVGLAEDKKGNLWISTSDGISKLNRNDQTFQNYHFSDGLQGRSFIRKSALTLSTGEILFGGTKGFNIFHPDSLHENSFNPPVLITGFSIFNHPVTINDPDSPMDKDITQANEINLDYDQSVFSFEFVSLDYTSPGKNQYAYKLEPFDKDWNYVKNIRLATYTNLDPGKYTFLVKASNDDGRWSEHQASVRLIIHPPWWQTYWFRGVSFLFIVVGIFSIYRIRVGVLEGQKKKLEQTVKLRTIEISEMNKEIETQNEELRAQAEVLAAQNDQLELLNNDILRQKNKIGEINQSLELKVEERTIQLNRTIDELNKTISELDRFVYSASHDLSAPLKSIRGLIHLTQFDEMNESVNEKIQYISSSIDQLEEVIKSLTEFSRNSRMELVLKEFLLKPEIQDCFNELKYLQPDIDLRMQVDIDQNVKIISDKMRLRIILNNLFSNAIKYQDQEKDEHFIKVTFEELEDQWRIICEDNGIGIEKDYLDRVFYMFYRATEKSKGSGLGLYIAHETAKKLGGDIFVQSDFGMGTTFTISIPRK